MTAKKAYTRMYITITLIIVTVLLYVFEASKLNLGWSFLGFAFCAFFAFLFSFKAIEAHSIDDEIKLTEKVEKTPNEFYDWITFLAVSMMLIFMLFMYFILPSSVSQTSMTPTLNDGERILIYHFNYKPQKRDIVIIKMSETDYPRAGGIANDKTYFVKRIVGTPGDVISYKYVKDDIYNIYINGKLYKNSVGESYEIKDYQKEALQLDLNNNIIPKGMYLVFGDNESGSQDSRSFGPVYEKDIIGKVIYKIWPLGGID